MYSWSLHSRRVSSHVESANVYQVKGSKQKRVTVYGRVQAGAGRYYLSCVEGESARPAGGLPRLDAWIGRRSSRRLGEASPRSGCPSFDHLFSLFPSYRAIIRGLMRRTPAVRSSNGLSFRSPGFLRSPQPISAPGVGSVYSQSVAGATVYHYSFLLATPRRNVAQLRRDLLSSKLSERLCCNLPCQGEVWAIPGLNHSQDATRMRRVLQTGPAKNGRVFADLDQRPDLTG